MPANKSSGYIHDSRGAIPKPRGTVATRVANAKPPSNPPAKNQSKAVSMSFTQEELSRRAKGFRGVGPSVKR